MTERNDLKYLCRCMFRREKKQDRKSTEVTKSHAPQPLGVFYAPSFRNGFSGSKQIPTNFHQIAAITF